jgi:hypothetical protein
MQQDSLRGVLDSVFAAPDYVWVERTPPLAFLARWLEGFTRWLYATREAHPVGFQLVLGALVILLVLILVHAGWILFHTIRGTASASIRLSETPVRRDRAWYRREADRLAGQGRYVEAMQAEFLALVLALEAAELLRFHPSKTPAEYGRESRLSPSAREEFRELVRALYGYAFARWPCGPGDFAGWRARALPERYARAD